MESDAITYRKVPLASDNHSCAEVRDVRLLGTKVEKYINEYGTYEERDLIVTLWIECIASSAERMVGIDIVDCQASLDSDLNPTDFYYRVRTEWPPGTASIATAGRTTSRWR